MKYILRNKSTYTPERGENGIDSIGGDFEPPQHLYDERDWSETKINSANTLHNPDFMKNNSTTQVLPKLEPEDTNEETATLEEAKFEFSQDANCIDGGEVETITIEAKSSLGIDRDDGLFYVIKTEQWAFNDIEELVTMLKRVEAAMKSMNSNKV